MDSKKKEYNWSIAFSETINTSLNSVWGIISKKSNLELFHPYCKQNHAIKWSKEDSIDELEYLNGLVLKRKFNNWYENEGYDLYINKKGKPASHVSWRLQEKNNKCKISIVISPYLYNQRGKIINFLPFFIFIKPSLTKYLKSVVGGLKWYAEEGLVVQKNQFGKHPWFS
tara:strand:+ start:2864 stop:3373 length:510 start_codon:yes stop_codon:yes gene_type:complete